MLSFLQLRRRDKEAVGRRRATGMVLVLCGLVTFLGVLASPIDLPKDVWSLIFLPCGGLIFVGTGLLLCDLEFLEDSDAE